MGTLNRNEQPGQEQITENPERILRVLEGMSRLAVGSIATDDDFNSLLPAVNQQSTLVEAPAA